MLEAVGERWWPGYFQQLARCLKPAAVRWCRPSPLPTSVLSNTGVAPILSSNTSSGRHVAVATGCCGNEVAVAGLNLQQNTAFGIDYAETLQAGASRSRQFCRGAAGL